MGSAYRPLDPFLNVLRYILVGVGFFLLFYHFLRRKQQWPKFRSYLSFYLFFIWILFGSTIFISEMTHHSIPIQGLFLLVFVPIIYFWVMPGSGKMFELVVLCGLFFSNFFYIVCSYIRVPITIFPYYGLAGNPNGFGQLSTLSFITAIYLLIVKSNGKRPLQKLKKPLLFCALSISFISVILSQSRTSLVVMGAITLFLLFIYIINHTSWKPLLFIFTIVTIFLLFIPKETLLSGLIDKFSTSHSQGDLLNGREEIWGKVINEAVLLGNGSSYFDGFTEGAHNSIIWILGVYGYLAALLFAIFLLFALIVSIQFIFKKGNNHLVKFLPFIITLTFILFSMTESMFGLIGTGITIAFYNVVGYLLFYSKK